MLQLFRRWCGQTLRLGVTALCVITCEGHATPLMTAKLSAQASVPTAGLQQVMQDILQQEQLTGVIWGTVTASENMLGAAGTANQAQQTALQLTHQFQVGSVAKTLLASGILRLVSQGKLSLDSPVATLLPDVPLINPWQQTHPLLLRHLLDHTSGLDDARLHQVFSLTTSPATPLAQAFAAEPARRLRAKPGSRLSYSNLGYTLLGMVIERLSGERYETVLARELLTPLGMHQSTFQYLSQLDPMAGATLAMGHFEQGVTQPAVPMQLRPAGQFTTTAADLALFARFLLCDGKLNGQVFIRPELMALMGRATTTEAAKAGLRAGYGLGLNTRDRFGVVGHCHVGTTFGFRANFCLFPQQKKAFFVAVNADVETARYERFDQVLIEQLGLPKQTPAPAVTMPPDIDDWLGIYQLAPVRMESFAYLDRLLNFARLHRQGTQLLLTPWQGKTQQLTPVGSRLFRANDRVAASHVLLSAGGRQVISDGFRSYERANLWTLLPLWLSAIAGISAFILLMLLGLWRTLCRRWQRDDALLPAWLAQLALLLPLPLFLAQSFLQLGDLTLASGLLAVTSAIWPLALLYSSWCYYRQLRQQRQLPLRQLLRWLAVLAVLQWCLVLAYWGLLPLRLWQ